jgi:hypothetical protein
MPQPRPVSRRQFLHTAGAVAGGIALGNSLTGRVRGAAPAVTPISGFSVNISTNLSINSSPTLGWALGQLGDALAAKGVAIRPQGELTIRLEGLAGSPGQLPMNARKPVPPAESQSIITSTDGKTLVVNGVDALGMAYALTELADRVRLSPDPRTALTFPAPIAESPANPIRSILRMFVSEVEDKPWFYDQSAWQKYLDMLVTNRFNRFNLSFGLGYDFSRGITDAYTFFMYPFFVNVPNYNVRALAKGGTPLPADEQKKNLDTLRFISDQAALRGLNFNLGIWTHSYTWTNSPNASHTISGLTAQTQAPYSRDAMKMLLQACPGITGITLRTHGESGVPEGSYDLWKIIMSGVTGLKNADGTPRIIELDLHAKTMTQEMIDTALSTGMPLTLSCKFWAEHLGLPYVQSSIREQEMPRATNATGLMALSSGTRSFLRYGIGDLLTKDRKYKVIHRVWPGTQRLLLWGDPLYAAEYGRAAHFAGMDGIEYFEPLSFKGRQGSGIGGGAAPDRSGYADATLRAPHDWEKYLYTFRLWGRLSYNPNAAPDTWQRQLKSDFGPAAAPLESALANASRILPLITTAHDPAAANLQYWPEIYVNMSLYDTTKVANYSEAPSPKVFGNVTSLDPQMFSSVNEYVNSLLAEKPLTKISPLQVARQLEDWSDAAFRALADAAKIDADRPTDKAAAPRRASIDAAIAAGMGRFFAHKLRAAMLWQLFNLSEHLPAREEALKSYRLARDAWAALADTAQVYVDDLTFGPDRHLRRHWKDRLADIDADLAGLATRAPQPRTTKYELETIDMLIDAITNTLPPAEEMQARRHTPPASFQPNQPLPLEIRTAFASVRLCYRHLHQGERYTVIDMPNQGGTFSAAIPAAYTNSPFPLQYYFELRTPTTAAMHPGFGPNFTGQPYYLVLPA